MTVQRFGFHMMPTRLVLTFDRALDATAADNLSNYRIKTMSGGRIKLKSAVYDDQTHTVTLRPVNRMNLHRKYSIVIVGSQPTGVEDVAGNMLDGTRSGTSGTDYHGLIIDKDLVIWGAAARAARACAGIALAETSQTSAEPRLCDGCPRGRVRTLILCVCPTFAHASGSVENAVCEPFVECGRYSQHGFQPRSCVHDQQRHHLAHHFSRGKPCQELRPIAGERVRHAWDLSP